MDDVLLNKAVIIERCLRRVDEEYAGDPARLRNFTHQDAVVLNLQRACQAAIDIAMHVLRSEHIGVPQSSANAFDLLVEAGRIEDDLARKLRGMVGFRNIAVHEYQRLDLDILEHIVLHSRGDLVEFCALFGITIR